MAPTKEYYSRGKLVLVHLRAQGGEGRDVRQRAATDGVMTNEYYKEKMPGEYGGMCQLSYIGF